MAMQGTIDSVNVEKGFGFIKGEDFKQYFFHRSALKNCPWEDLKRGQEVTFEDAVTDKGPRAEDVWV